MLYFDSLIGVSLSEPHIDAVAVPEVAMFVTMSWRMHKVAVDY